MQELGPDIVCEAVANGAIRHRQKQVWLYLTVGAVCFALMWSGYSKSEVQTAPNAAAKSDSNDSANVPTFEKAKRSSHSEDDGPWNDYKSILKETKKSSPGESTDSKLAATNEIQALQLRAAKGDADAQAELGARYARYGDYVNGGGVPQDYATAVKWLRLAAEQGNAKGQNGLGVIFESGNGVLQDYVEAVKWYRKAAEQGLAKAQGNLGLSYAVGRGVPQDYIEAVKWFRLAAEQGYVRAQSKLGLCYFHGNGVDRDYTEALKWWRKAAEQGDAEAEYHVGISLYDVSGGNFKDKDNGEALKWWRKSARQGNADAQLMLGDSYAFGRGVVKDSAEAARWFRRAAEQGQPAAQADLARLYWHGEGGLPENDVEAYKWFSIAIAEAKPADFLKCNGGVSAPANDSMVIINGVSISTGETALIRTSVGQIAVKCVKIEGGKAQIKVEGETQTRTLDMALKRPFPRPCQITFNSRSALEKLMTREQIADGQRRAAAFVPRTEGTAPDGDDSVPRPEIAEGMIATGTGFFITDDGYFVTCAHVVQGATSFHVNTSGGWIPARLVKKDAGIDVALLKVAGTYPGLPMATESRVKLGDSVFTIGFPNTEMQGVAPKFTRGEISSLAGVRDNPRYYQISVPTQHGNSGGALVDERGNVVGVVAAILDDVMAYKATGSLPQNVNYAIKGGLVYNFLSGVPELSGKLKTARTVKDQGAANTAAERAAVLVIAE